MVLSPKLLIVLADLALDRLLGQVWVDSDCDTVIDKLVSQPKGDQSFSGPHANLKANLWPERDYHRGHDMSLRAVSPSVSYQLQCLVDLIEKFLHSLRSF